MKRVGVVGAGRIGAPVIAFLRGDPHYSLVSVLVRRDRGDDEPLAVANARAFFSLDYDLIIETGGPAALREHGARALARADVWSVSASALADVAFRDELAAVGAENGHRLRLVSGSVSGLDGAAAMAAADPSARLRLFAKRPISDRAGSLFSGALPEGAKIFPDEVNFAIATALAGPGADRATLELSDSGPLGAHELGFRLDGGFGAIESIVRLKPLSESALHPVAASLIAALSREAQTIWAG